jgi:deoxyribonuclease-4
MFPPAEKLLFGTAGIPHSAGLASSLSGIKRIAELGLDCLEIEFVKGIMMGGETAQKISERASSCRIELSVHAPYYINLNSAEPGKKLASQDTLLRAARMAAKCGARSVVFHAGYYGRDDPGRAYDNIKGSLRDIISILRSERNPVLLRLETMGKRSQFGTLEEVLFLCREIDGVQPCIDFSHIHAREGKFNSYRDFSRVLRKIEKKLGSPALRNLHIHISGVIFSDKGELKHINLMESDFHYDDWLQALRDFGVGGMAICESPNLEADALMLKKLYRSLSVKSDIRPSRPWLDGKDA